MAYITKMCQCNIQRIVSFVKTENFDGKKLDIFNIFAQKLIEYPQSMFWIKNKENIPQFYYKKVGYEGVFISWTCFPDGHITHDPLYSIKAPSA